MKDLIEQISAKSEAFLKDANSQLDKGEQGGRTTRPPNITRTGAAPEAVPQSLSESFGEERLITCAAPALIYVSGRLSQTLSHEAEDNLSEKNRQTQQVC